MNTLFITKGIKTALRKQNKRDLVDRHTHRYEQTQVLTEPLGAFCLFKLLGGHEEKQPLIFHQPGKKQSGWKGEVEPNSQDSPRIREVFL